jgi:threonyl-tRNA synthetase
MPKDKVPVDIQAMRHSAAHLLAAAVQELYPTAKFGVGPVVANGFFYDMDLPVQLSPADLKPIEKKMAEIKKRHDDFVRKEMPIDEAIEFFRERQQDYKVELLTDLKTRGSTAVVAINEEESFDIDPKGAESASVYETGKFVDLCRGPHISNSQEIGAFKLTKIAGAYWRGKETNKMLQRIYGLAFASQTELDEHLAMMEEAEKRDHRKVGAELEIFMFHQTAPGMPYWLPKGVRIYNELIKFWRKEHFEEGYLEIISPLINKKDLYVTSGHYEHYWSDMFVATTPEGEEYGLKAMNCPNAMIVFGSKSRSYRELPLRLSDTDTLHRFERSGTLNGLLRVREFRQDDAHIFVTEEQIGSEFKTIFKLVEKFYSVFGMTYSFRFGTRPASFMGDIATWDSAEATLRGLLEESGQNYILAAGDGAFYGPKVDILMNDSLGREWQMGTIQLDFQQPRRFELEYTASDGSKKTPIAIHRVIYGSMERFIGILIEHFAGAFPVWLSPVQVSIIPVGESHVAASRALANVLIGRKIKVEVDDSSETVGKKIRKSESTKVPYSLVIGDKEVPVEGEWKEKTKLGVRRRGSAELIELTLEKFMERLNEEMVTRRDK